MADAMPASFGATPSVAAETVGAKMQPIATPMTSRPGRTPVPKLEVGVSWVNRTIPTTPSAMPRSTSGFTPVCWITRVWTVVEVMTSTTLRGRNARPVLSGEKARFCCRK